MKFQKYTQKTAREILTGIGYTLRHLDGEFETYPVGQRGEKSNFTTCLDDAVQTARAEARRTFTASLELVNLEPLVKSALVAFHAEHGKNWLSELYRAWGNGCYGSHSKTNVASILQSLRNSTLGREIVASI